MKDFTELKYVYRARLDLPDGRSFISNTSFDSYDECFNYASSESKNILCAVLQLLVVMNLN